jgi:hypothetical protein
VLVAPGNKPGLPWVYVMAPVSVHPAPVAVRLSAALAPAVLLPVVSVV